MYAAEAAWVQADEQSRRHILFSAKNGAQGGVFLLLRLSVLKMAAKFKNERSHPEVTVKFPQ